MGIKIGELKEMTARELSGLSRAGIREAYQTLRKIANSRIRTFEKHGAADAVPAALRGGLGSSKGRPDADLIQDMRGMLAWMRGKRSTYKGYEETQEHFREAMQDAMPDLDLSDKDKFDAYGRFMGEMQERYKEMWHDISNIVRDVYNDLTRLNEDPRQFMKNYDYWADEVERINREKKEQHIGGRRRSSKMSTYMRKLKKGKLK